MRKLTAVLIGAAVSAAFLATCQRSEDRHLKRRIEPNDLVGRWVMKSTSAKDLADVGYTAPIDPLQHTIAIDGDGTCQFHTFPSALTADGRANSLIDRRCRWSLREVVGRQVLLLDLIGEPSFVVRYNLGEDQGALVLWQHADDPDAWRYLEYTKR